MATRLTGNYLKAIVPSTKIQSYSWRRITLLFASWRMHRGQPWILDSTLWIPDSRYWIPVFVSGTWIVDSIVSGMPDSLSRVPWPGIPDSKSKIFLESGFHKHIIPGFRNPDSLT